MSALILAIGFLVILFGIAPGAAQAQTSTRPFWTEQAMFRFGDEVYFVGVASCVRTAEEARVRAFDAGMKELGAYAQGRDTTRLFIETAMIYEEADSVGCSSGTASAWRLLRVKQARIEALPKRMAVPEPQNGLPPRGKEGVRPSDSMPALSPPPLPDLTPHAAMSREEIAQRFGKPKTIRKRGQEEIWDYSNTGLTITFSPGDTLISWTAAGKSDPQQQPRQAEPAKPAESIDTSSASQITADPSQSEPIQQALARPIIPPSRDPIAEGRALFNGKGLCHTCHGRDADMFTDVRREDLFGVPPGYQPFPFTPFAGPSPRRMPPNLRDWFTLRIRTDLDLARAIKDGIAGSTMTGTGHLTDREISDLIAYLNSLR